MIQVTSLLGFFCLGSPGDTDYVGTDKFDSSKLWRSTTCVN